MSSNTEFTQLVESLSAKIKDYRSGEIDARSPHLVDRWVRQFDENSRIHILRELNHVLSHTYWSKARVETFFAALAKTSLDPNIGPRAYWSGCSLLEKQQKGESQVELTKLFKECLARGMHPGNPGKSIDNSAIYIDDFIFSGNHLISDMKEWISGFSTREMTVTVIALGFHTGGTYFAEKRLKDDSKKDGRQLNLLFYGGKTFENRKIDSNTSEVLWPTCFPSTDAENYNSVQQWPCELREPIQGWQTPIFSSEHGRQTLEREFLLAGLRIRSFSREPEAMLRPLGFGQFGFGFGSLLVSYRNCPNNCPLALWWGDPEYPTNHPFHNWFPLLPRKTNEPKSPFLFEADVDDYDPFADE